MTRKGNQTPRDKGPSAEAMQLIRGEISYEEYFGSMDEEKRLRGDGSLLRRLLSTREWLDEPGLTTSELDADLTARDVDTLCCAARGLTVAETAETLSVGQETIRSRRKAIQEKLHARNMTHAVAIWIIAETAFAVRVTR